MSSYHSSFIYLNQNSRDYGWIISHFDADSGESETGLSTESIYTASYDGTSRNLYGTKYTGAEPIRITVIKQDGSDFSIKDNRRALKWLTGAKTDSWLDLYIGDEMKCRVRGHVQNVLQYKMDARIVGLTIVFESASPFAFSSPQVISQSVSGEKKITIANDTDDVYNYTPMKTTYTNGGNKENVVITNETTGDETKIYNVAANEVITLDTNQMITSDKDVRIFGTDFNFIFPRLAAGVNTLTVNGNGNIKFEYYYCIKIGDMAIDLNAVSDPICDEFDHIKIDMLDWNRISNTPRTLAGYGITDAYTMSSVYNKEEIDSQVSGLTHQVESIASLVSEWSNDLSTDYYNKTETDAKFYSKTEIEDNYYDKSDIDEQIEDLDFDIQSNASLISSVATDLTNNYYNKEHIQSNYYNKNAIRNDIYTKQEIDKKIDDIEGDIQSNASVISAVSSDLAKNYYDKTHIENKYHDKTAIRDIVYTKQEIDEKIDDITFEVQSNASLISSISSDLRSDYYNKSNIEDKYYSKKQVDDIIANLTYDPVTGTGLQVIWSQIVGKPTTLSEYGVKSEVQELIDKSIAEVQVAIDESELNAMLNEILV